MTTIAGLILALILFLLTILVIYEWVLAVCSFFYRSRVRLSHEKRTRFLVLIPAHNEELGMLSTLESLGQLNYARDEYRVVVIADRCTDKTAAIARSLNAQCFERLEGRTGKGAALAWGIQEAKKAQILFDAVVIVDADTVVDRDLLAAFDQAFQAGYHVQQGYNYISNPWTSPFTRIIAVTGVLRNGRYYAGKTVLGLQGMLTGTGMCLSARIIDDHGWTAFSVGEDWELSVDLLLAGNTIYFNPAAKTFAKESQNLKQAGHQRLRWAGGRYAIMGRKTFALVKQGVQTRSIALIDSAITLIAPNYSSQASLAILCLAGSWLVAADPFWEFCFYWSLSLISAIGAYFVMGVLSTESPGRALAGVFLIPVFLPWRLAIELLGMVGYGRRSWGRMSRPASSSQSAHR